MAKRDYEVTSYVLDGEDFRHGYAPSRMNTAPTEGELPQVQHLLVHTWAHGDSPTGSTSDFYWIHYMDLEDWQDVEDIIQAYEVEYDRA